MIFLRTITLAFAAFLLAVGSSAAEAAPLATIPALRSTGLQQRIDALVQRARPGVFGVAVLDLPSGVSWRANDAQAFPMMSVIKAPVAAAVLDRVERGTVSMDQFVTIHRADLESGSILNGFQGEQMRFSVSELLTEAVSNSDNTAVDALLKLMGGPAVVTRYLQGHGIKDLRIDLGESGMHTVFSGLPSGQRPPADETDAQQLVRLRRGYAAYLMDPRNRSTPNGAVDFLHKLWRNELLSPASTKRLIDLMRAQTTPERLRGGLPRDVLLADKCGTSYTLENSTAAFNDIGILTWPDGHTVIIAAFLTRSTASLEERTALFADLTRAVTAALHP